MDEFVRTNPAPLLTPSSSYDPPLSHEIQSAPPLLRIQYPSPSLEPQPSPPLPLQIQATSLPQKNLGLSFLRPAIRVTSEFDSDNFVFLHKLSCKIFDSLAKLKLTFQNNDKGVVSDPLVAFISKHLSINYDPQEHNALLKSSFDLGDKMQFRVVHNLKAQQGEVGIVANLDDPAYKFELSSSLPAVGLPKATFKFPLGEVSLEEGAEDVNKTLSIGGIVTSQLMNAKCTAQYKDGNLFLKHFYKDKEMSFMPSISLPSNSLSFAFKRRFSPSNKLSYWYDFDSNEWSTVYKVTRGKEYKFKAGYDSGVRVGWASVWFGDEFGKVKCNPLKMKAQVMLQVPRDNLGSSVLLLRVKKRWDF